MIKSLKGLALLVLSVLCHILLVNSQTQNSVIKIPPFDVSQKDILPFLSVQGDITFQVPAVYVFGDSLLDNGRCVSLPYGVDFGGKPSGRITNGRNLADFIAQMLGLPFPNSFYNASGSSNTITGIDYAFSGCGIRNDTGLYPFGLECTPLAGQITNFESSISSLSSHFQSKDALDKHISSSLFLIVTGFNDISLTYGWDPSKFNNDIESFVSELANLFYQQAERLYKLGARKFLVGNANPGGCIPSRRMESPSCNETMTGWTDAFNKKLAETLTKLEAANAGSKFVYMDMGKVLHDVITNPGPYGIIDVSHACCATDPASPKPGCLESKPDSCPNGNQFVFFDRIHPTEVMHFLTLKRCIEDSTICSTTLVQLLQA
ncbi:hypothetical protein K2173_021137 [Erythroxylum novogranatense]|uniref:Uncharacterized protein n=1 Tax=Erythroxylum novogranatense TaxID=1862640 RepID=A0AAV8TMW4_9ROSI|nr:hypothetical protein K2173_021137 [Erythroxylum novogranatense]